MCFLFFCVSNVIKRRRRFTSGLHQVDSALKALGSDFLESLESVYILFFSFLFNGGFQKFSHNLRPLHVGWNPFFDNSRKTIEPWLLHDFEEDFYDQAGLGSATGSCDWSTLHD